MSCNPRCTYGEYDPCTKVETELAKKIETVKVGDVTASKTDGIVTITKEDIEALGISAGGYSAFSIGTYGPIRSENPITETKADGTTATYTNTSDFIDRLNELVSAGIEPIWVTTASVGTSYYSLNYIRTGLMISGQTVARFGLAYATSSRIVASTIEVAYDTDAVIRREMNVAPSSGSGTVYLFHTFQHNNLSDEPITTSDGRSLSTLAEVYTYIDNAVSDGKSVAFSLAIGDEYYVLPTIKFGLTDDVCEEIAFTGLVFSTAFNVNLYSSQNNKISRGWYGLAENSYVPRYQLCHTETIGAVSDSNPIESPSGYWDNVSDFLDYVNRTYTNNEREIWMWKYADRVYYLVSVTSTTVKFVSDDGTTKSVLTVDSNGVSVSSI